MCSTLLILVHFFGISAWLQPEIALFQIIQNVSKWQQISLKIYSVWTEIFFLGIQLQESLPSLKKWASWDNHAEVFKRTQSHFFRWHFCCRCHHAILNSLLSVIGRGIKSSQSAWLTLYTKHQHVGFPGNSDTESTVWQTFPPMHSNVQFPFEKELTPWVCSVYTQQQLNV